MSVQVKKRIEVLRTYLGRDTKGLELLDLLKDEVTVLRKKLAASEAKAEQEATIKLQARERADATEVALAESAAEMQRLRQQVANLIRDMSVVTKPDEEEECEPSGRGTIESQLLPVVKALKKIGAVCPYLIISPPAKHRFIPTVARYDVASGWSHTDMWLLGATTALLAELNGHVTVTSPNLLTNVMPPEKHPTFKRHFARWFQKNLDAGDAATWQNSPLQFAADAAADKLRSVATSSRR